MINLFLILLFSYGLHAECKEDKIKKLTKEIGAIYARPDFQYKRFSIEEKQKMKNLLHKDDSLRLWLK